MTVMIHPFISQLFRFVFLRQLKVREREDLILHRCMSITILLLYRTRGSNVFCTFKLSQFIIEGRTGY